MRGARREVRGGKMRGTGARYQCEALGNLRGWNVRGAADNWRKRRRLLLLVLLNNWHTSSWSITPMGGGGALRHATCDRR